MQRSLTFVFSVFLCITLLTIASCKEQSSQIDELAEIRRAIAQIAPKGGDGQKDYFYDDGALKESVIWENSLPIEFRYYDKAGKLIYQLKPQSSVAVQISLYESGKVKEIFQSKEFVKNGPCFKLSETGQLMSVEIYDMDNVVSEYMPEQDNAPRADK